MHVLLKAGIGGLILLLIASLPATHGMARHIHSVLLLEGAKPKPRNEKGEVSKKLAKGLGVLSFYLGIVLNIIFSFYNWVRPLSLRLKAKPSFTYRRALTFHAVSNILLALAALYHSIYFIDKARLLEYLLVGTMIILVGSGSVMTYMSIRRIKRLAAMLHIQRGLALLLLILVALHVAFKP